MLQFAANLSFMFNEWDFADRFGAAADAGFKAVEFGSHLDLSAQRIATLLDCHGLTQALANMPMAASSKGLAAVAGQQGQFRIDFHTGLEYAVAAKAPLLHVTAGVVGAAEHESAQGVFAENLQWAIEEAAAADVVVVVEAINQTAIPGYFIRSLTEASEWTVRCPGLGLLLDIYHACMEGLDPVAALHDHLGKAAHVQIAGYPGRHEPACRQAPFSTVLDAISSAPYAGWVGCEYVPEHHTLQGLDWMNRSAT
jgi:hydroxypyruvate isomerase